MTVNTFFWGKKWATEEELRNLSHWDILVTITVSPQLFIIGMG